MNNKRLLSSEEYNLFEKILKASQEGLRASMQTFLEGYYGEDRVLATKDFIMAFGDIPVGLVAHMDTVHRCPVCELFYDKDKNVMWSPEGLGADDRAGVFSILQIIKGSLKPTIILTTDEEIGGVGAGVLISQLSSNPCNLKFLIELDRQGHQDSVYYDCGNEEFETYINSYGFVSDWGTFSDISLIAPVWGIAAVNLSVGYVDEHTTHERLYVDSMFNTIDKVCLLLEEVDSEKEYEYIDNPATGYSFLGYDIPNGSYYNYDAYSKKGMCWGCLDSFDKELLINTEDGAYCGDCYAKTYTTCVKCKEEFQDPMKVHLTCPKCREEF